jgi:predicted nucleic acid-binding protein
MKAVFADTFYYIALTSESDLAHKRAMQISQELNRAAITTAWVLTEVADPLSAPSQRPIFLDLMRSLEADRDVTIIPPDANLFRAGVDLFAKRPDKYWSLTDCISFVVMKQLNLEDVLTGDHHFQQAGFNALLC